MEKGLFIKYLSNKCTEIELNEVLSWVNGDELNEEGKVWIFEDWKSYKEVSNSEDDENFAAIFDRIQEKIEHNNEKNSVKANNIILLSNLRNWITRVAAILLIPVLTFLFYTLSEKKIESDKYACLAVDSVEVIAPLGSRTVVQLSDGSEVHLNYGSKIKYPLVFLGHTRGVTLTGEGFFKVVHNSEKPFIVKAGNLNIKALGTTFNVVAYSDDAHIETTLVNGKVVLYKTEQNGKSKSIVTMTPGQHVDYSTLTDEISITEGNIDKYISWTDGKLILEDTPILQVTKELSRMFNVDFEVKNDVKDYEYTVTFTDEHLSQILDLMSIATPVVYKILPRKKMQNGTFSKEKIIIEKR